MEQLEFVDAIFNSAQSAGLNVWINRNGDRQVDFGNKSLTDDYVRRLYQDIRRKKNTYTQDDFKQLVAGRPCAVAPFFRIAQSAGLCSEGLEGSRKIYRFSI